jgi:hypothetical protein
MDEELISRGENVALHFNVSDIAVSLRKILGEVDDGEEETDED